MRHQTSGRIKRIRETAGADLHTDPQKLRSVIMMRISHLSRAVINLEKDLSGQRCRSMRRRLRDYTIALYKKCAEYALSKGIIIADTKFEFGLDENGNVVLGDEMLTPDSSRFWPLEGYEAGKGTAIL